jgi:hypothetical protein
LIANKAARRRRPRPRRRAIETYAAYSVGFLKLLE